MQQNRELRDTSTHGQIILNKGAMTIQWEKSNYFNNGIEETGYMQKNENRA